MLADVSVKRVKTLLRRLHTSRLISVTAAVTNSRDACTGTGAGVALRSRGDALAQNPRHRDRGRAGGNAPCRRRLLRRGRRRPERVLRHRILHLRLHLRLVRA